MSGQKSFYAFYFSNVIQLSFAGKTLREAQSLCARQVL
jgi:hypothetical protein